MDLNLPLVHRVIHINAFIQEAITSGLLCPAQYSEVSSDQIYMREINRTTDVHTCQKAKIGLFCPVSTTWMEKKTS